MKTIEEIKSVSTMVLDPTLRHDFIYLFDATNCNPNGDPDSGNQPRVNDYNELGLVSDVCMKRRVKDFAAAYANKSLYIQSNYLSDVHQKAHDELVKQGKEDKKTEAQDISEYMRNTYWDVKMCGSPLAEEKFRGAAINGPLQMNMAESVDPIANSIDIIRLTRSVENKPKAKSKSDEFSENGTFGEKWFVPYALYKTTGSVEAYKAICMNVTEEDLYILFTGLEYMWQTSMAAGRSGVMFRGLYIFTHPVEHNSTLRQAGVERLDKLHDSLVINKKNQGDTPQSFNDYEVEINKTGINPKVEIYDWANHLVL